MALKKGGGIQLVDDVLVTSANLASEVTGTLPVANGGTGQTTYTNGQLLIGNTTGNTLTKATLTAGTGITITNGTGTIIISVTAGTADVVGPASATDNAIARFDGTTGKLIQNSGIIIDDSNNVTGIVNYTGTGFVATGDTGVRLQTGSVVRGEVGGTGWSQTSYLTANLRITNVNVSPDTAGNWTYISGPGASSTGGLLLMVTPNGASSSGDSFKILRASESTGAGVAVASFAKLFQVFGNGNTYIAGTALIGTSVHAAGSPRMTIGGGTIQLVITENSSDATIKNSRFGSGHYTIAEEPIALIMGSASSGANTINIGGGTVVMNAATSIQIFTAANSTTVTGTRRAYWDSTGQFVQEYQSQFQGAVSVYVGNTVLQRLRNTLLTADSRTFDFRVESDGGVSSNFVLRSSTDAGTTVLEILRAHHTTGLVDLRYDLNVQGAAAFNGNVTLGNATSDTITFTGRVSSIITPSVDLTFDFGSPSLRWAFIYSGYYRADAGSTALASFSSTTDTNTGLYFPAADTLGLVTGGSEKVNISSAGLVTIINNLSVATSIGVSDAIINVGQGRSGSGFAYIDLVGDTTYSDYGLRLIRGNTGANAVSYLQHRGTGEFGLIAQDAAPVVIHTSGLERVKVDSSGLVGIGTNPAYKLDIAVASATDADIFRAGMSGVANGLTVRRVASSFITAIDGDLTVTKNGAAQLITSSSDTQSVFRLIAGTVTADWTADTSVAMLRTLSNHPIVFLTNATEKVRILTNGNVGIGLAAPSTKLHIYDTAAVEARIEGVTGTKPIVGLRLKSDTISDFTLRTLGTDEAQLYDNNNAKALLAVKHTVAAGETGLFLYDVDNNTLERVTVGAADSGGVGYKVLRIPN